ncbi:DUF5694 domain-containing protein [Ornithinibacillus salinisoli]|uniref:DUF5694 domain-containing protein n=1 Tax=Ornithinibacillus salinisoli TaxID=1848459 RepID=A0ABW4VTG7_9BACI
MIIYSTIASLVENGNDRILLLVGSAHIHLVRQILRESGLVDVELSRNIFSHDQHNTGSEMNETIRGIY